MNLKMVKFATGAAVAIAAVGGITVAASSGSAGSAPEPSAAEAAVKSTLIANVPEVEGAPRLEPTRAQTVDMKRAPSGMASNTYLVIPSDKGPCLLKTNEGDPTKPSSLSCGADAGPTVAITPEGTIGAVSNTKTDSVRVILKNGATVAADVDASGVWFAAPGAKKAIVTSDGVEERVIDLDLNFGDHTGQDK
jgi:hypothetical protein